jgi:predicted Zn-dependent protease
MPSHIFLPLGMWDDMVASNERAWAASRAWAARGGRPSWNVDWHSLNWLQYAYLQQGRWATARALVDTARVLAEPARRVPGSGGPDATFALEQLAFRYGAETGHWDMWPADPIVMDWRDPALTPRARGMALTSTYQRAVAAILARRDTVPAVAAVRAFREVDAEAPGGAMAARLAAQIEVMVMQARGDRDEALAALQKLQPDTRAPRHRSMVPPSTLIMSEQLGASLLDAGRAQEAVTAYQQALEDRPNRAAALLGLARAKAAAGDRAGATEAYARLLAVWQRADSTISALAEARRSAGGAALP